MVSMNFLRVSRFPEKGVIFPPLISGVRMAGVGLGLFPLLALLVVFVDSFC